LNHHWHPHWWHEGYHFRPWHWVIEIDPGYWQCSAFNEYGQEYDDVGPTENEAAWNALYDCGGRDPEDAGCYIPEGYCQVR
jgi:hypothetical protein